MQRKTAFTLVELIVVLAIVAILAAMLVPAIQAARETARKTGCRNNLKQQGTALHLYHGVHQCFPSGYIYGGPLYGPPGANPSTAAMGTRLIDAPPPSIQYQPNDPGWGWAALMLPFLEQTGLSRQLDFDRPVWDVVNAEPRTRMLAHLTCPSDRQTGVFQVYDEVNTPVCEVATSSYAACFGSYGLMNTDPDDGNGLFQRNSRHRSADVTDGLAQTLAIGERAALFAKGSWPGVMTGATVRTTPGAPVFTAIIELAPALVMARMGNRTLNSPYSEPYDFFSAHAEIVFFAFADGSVGALTSSTDHEVLHALATRNQGEVVGAY
jgi:prepilin-type N-terminal cleavage/methylation domain-containing protein